MANTATKIDWDCAVTKRHIKEAEAVGLTLIGVGRTARHRTYRFNKCGHKQEIETGNVRKNKFTCDICKKKTQQKRVLIFGEYEYIKTEIDWDSPFTKKHIKEAETVGLTLVGVGKNKRLRNYRFDRCGHEQEIGTAKVRIGNFTCKQCIEDKLNSEARAVGLTLIDFGKNRRLRKYCFDRCGHEQEISTDSVRKNKFICNTCEETARDLPSKVYLLKITVDTVIQSFTWLKLGYAKSVSTRIKDYGLPSDAVIERLKVMDFETGREANLYEASLHTKYLRKRLPIKKMKEFMAEGFNECYPLEMLDTLMKDLEAKEKRMKK